MSKELEALETLKFLVDNYGNFEFDFTIIEKPLKALEIIKENVGLKMSVDDNVGCLYVPIIKTFVPLEESIVVVGFVQGQDKIELLKEVLL